MLWRIRLGLGCRPIVILKRRSPLIGGAHALLELTPVGGADQDVTEAIEYPEYESFD